MTASRFPLSVPTKWAICSCCEGEGKVGNPAFSLGFSSEEWSDMTHDYDDSGESSAAERYLRGAYDVPCTECKGAGKVRVPDVSRMTYAQKRTAAAQRREDRLSAMYAAESAAEYAAERRMGC